MLLLAWLAGSCCRYPFVFVQHPQSLSTVKTVILLSRPYIFWERAHNLMQSVVKKVHYIHTLSHEDLWLSAGAIIYGFQRILFSIPDKVWVHTRCDFQALPVTHWGHVYLQTSSKLTTYICLRFDYIFPIFE